MPSAVWNVRFKGLNAVYEEASETLVPVWYPWPGESVVLTIERPQAIDGQTLTVQSVSRKLDLGRRRRNTRLELQIESSLGGEFPVHLPAEATVRSVQRDGRMLPIRREEGRVGIWCDTKNGQEAKIGAIGVRIRKWVTMHGFAVNIAPDLNHFSGIVPCGISEYPVTSLGALGIEATLADFDAALHATFASFLNSLAKTAGNCTVAPK